MPTVAKYVGMKTAEVTVTAANQGRWTTPGVCVPAIGEVLTVTVAQKRTDSVEEAIQWGATDIYERSTGKKVEVVAERAPRTRPATREINGLYATMDKPRSWVVRRVSDDLVIRPGVSSKRRAEEAMHAITSLGFDWSGCPDDIAKRVDEPTDVVSQIRMILLGACMR